MTSPDTEERREVQRFEPVVQPVRWPLSGEVSQEPGMRPSDLGEYVHINDHLRVVHELEEATDAA